MVRYRIRLYAARVVYDTEEVYAISNPENFVAVVVVVAPVAFVEDAAVIVAKVTEIVLEVVAGVENWKAFVVAFARLTKENVAIVAAETTETAAADGTLMNVAEIALVVGVATVVETAAAAAAVEEVAAAVVEDDDVSYDAVVDVAVVANLTIN